MPRSVENSGSTARDFCMLERNILSHFKLGLLLSLLSSSILLHARLPGPTPNPSNPDGGDSGSSKTNIPMAAVQFVAALVAIGAGAWEYWSKERDLRNMRAFLVASKPHTALLTVVSGVVLTTCVILLADVGEL